MEAAIETAIKVLTNIATNAKQPHEAMQLTQAALNLAHALQVLKQIK